MDQPLVRGLTLGKFAPLHKGHQLLIETALTECDELTCIVYDSRYVTSIPLSVRAGWIRTLYPTVRVIEARHGPSEVGDTAEIRRAHEAYVMDALGIRRVDRFYSNESYGEHMSRALGAVDRRVPFAKVLPVSGTVARSAPFGFRAFLNPLVYRDHVIAAVFLGAPGTGKSTLAARLAGDLGTVFMPEYGREYWERHHTNRRLRPEELLLIAERHLEREDARIMRARDYLFVDTNALTTALYARHYHGAVDPRLAAIADSCVSRYDLVFLCEDDCPCPTTWDRSGPGDRAEMQKRVEEDLTRRGLASTRLFGSIEERVACLRFLPSSWKEFSWSQAPSVLGT